MLKIFVVSCDDSRFEKMVRCSMDSRLQLVGVKSPLYTESEVYKRGNHPLDTNKTVLGITACLIGHMRAMKAFIETTTEDYGIIAEDDVRFHKNFFETIVRVLPLIKDYDNILTGFVDLPHIGTIEIFNGVEIIRDVKHGNPPRTQCYIVSRDFVIKFLDRFDTDFIYNEKASIGYTVKRATLALPIAIEEPGIFGITGNAPKKPIKGLNMLDFYIDYVASCLIKIKEYMVSPLDSKAGTQSQQRINYQNISKLYFELGDVYNAENWAMKAYNIDNHPETLYFLIKHFRETNQYFKAVHYYNLVKDCNQSEFTEILLYEYSLCKYYVDSDKIVGTKMMVDFINTHTKFKDACIQNLQYYLPRLVSIFGSKPIQIDNTVIEGNFFPSNVSLLKLEGGNLIANVRLINYKIVKGEKHRLYDDNLTVRTKNLCLFIDPISLDTIVACTVEDGADINPNTDSNIKGIEDIRLFYKNGVVCYSGSTNEYSYSNTVRIITGTYNYKKGILESNTVLRPQTENQLYEKNWIFVDNNVIYSWYPMTIGKIVNNELWAHTVYDVPAIFENMRGSTVTVNRGDEHWCITHSTYYGSNCTRSYNHYFIVLNKHLKPVKMSIPFCFKEPGIEFCLGLYLTSTDFVLSCSFNDRTPEFIRIPIAWVENVLLYDL